MIKWYAITHHADYCKCMLMLTIVHQISVSEPISDGVWVRCVFLLTGVVRSEGLLGLLDSGRTGLVAGRVHTRGR